jgi:polyisoprenoid-binding protein YceI
MNTMKTIAAGSVLTLALAGSVAGLGGWGSAASEETTTAAAATTTATSNSATTTYKVDGSHSSVNFRIIHGQVAPFYGRFNDFSGSIDLNSEDMSGTSMEFKVLIRSIDTDNSKRDAHLRDADFFNARQFPTATFESNKVVENSDGSYSVTGDLNLHGVTKEVTAEVTHLKQVDGQQGSKMGFEAKFSIKRSDFEMTKYLAADGGEDGPLSNTVQIIVAVEAVSE